MVKYTLLVDEISILAPARGATGSTYKGYFTASAISILAPARGATRVPYKHKMWILFQFSPLREGRRLIEGRKTTLDPISILAPARGATRSEEEIREDVKPFQFSPLREGRLLHCFLFLSLFPFDFNSRPCERGDQTCRQW